MTAQIITSLVLAAALVVSPTATLANQPKVLRHIEQNTTQHGDRFQKAGNTIILMYHAFIAEGEPTKEQNSLYTTAQKLGNDIDELRALGYESISLWKYRMGLFDAKKKYFILTFDDGYVNNYEVAYPVLVEKQAYADIFVNSGMIGSTDHLNGEMWLEMEESGLVHVYSHLDTHTRATTLSPEVQEQFLALSQATLSEYLGDKNLWGMSYPYGDYDREIGRAHV